MSSTRDHTPVREPEISELRAFCAAASLGSIAEAARAMNVSQPAMSKRLRVLETVAGSQLLDRTTHGVTLTPAGEQLYTVAQRVLKSADSVSALIGSSTSLEIAKIASSPTASEQRLSGILAELASTTASFAAEVTTTNTWAVREMVRDGRYEIGIAATDSYVPRADDLHEQWLWRDEIVVAVPAEHRWSQIEEIPLEEFAATRMIERDPYAHSSRLVAVVCEQAEVRRAAPMAQLGSTDAIIALASNLGIPALVSAATLPVRSTFLGALVPRLFPRRVEGLRFTRDFVLVWTGILAGMSAPAQAVAKRLMTED